MNNARKVAEKCEQAIAGLGHGKGMDKEGLATILTMIRDLAMEVSKLKRDSQVIPGAQGGDKSLW